MRGPVFRACVLVISVAWGLGSCRAPTPPEAVLAERCEPISGSAPLRFDVVPQSGGALQVHIEQRGVSIVARASGLERTGQVTSTQSPIERFGVMTLLASVSPRQPIAVELQSRCVPCIVAAP